MRAALGFIAGAVCAFVVGSAAAQAPPTPMPAGHPGEAIYQASCAGCHDNPEQTRAPARATLGRMRYQTINFALTKGKMQVQGQALNDTQRHQLVSYLSGKSVDLSDDWTKAMMCQGPGRPWT